MSKEIDDKTIKLTVLEKYLSTLTGDWKLSSRDICDNLRDTVALEPHEVTRYMMNRGYKLTSEYGNLLWVAKE